MLIKVFHFIGSPNCYCLVSFPLFLLSSSVSTKDLTVTAIFPFFCYYSCSLAFFKNTLVDFDETFSCYTRKNKKGMTFKFSTWPNTSKIPSQYFEYYHTKSFTEIDSTRSIEPLTFTGCNSKLDIVFLLDSSSSEGPANFKKQVQFVENFVNQFNVGPDAAQFSVVTFSTTVHNEFYLNTHSTVSGVVRGIHKVIYHTGQTYTDKALNHAHRVSFKPQHGGRPDAEKIVIVLTDGISADPTHTRYISYWLMKWIHYKYLQNIELPQMMERRKVIASIEAHQKIWFKYM